MVINNLISNQFAFEGIFPLELYVAKEEIIYYACILYHKNVGIYYKFHREISKEYIGLYSIC